jgi:hypothetical protein
MNDVRAIQDWYTNRLKEYHAQVYQANEDFPKTEIDPAVAHPMDTELSLSAKKIPRAEHDKLPAPVRDAFQFYWDRFEKEDIGFVRAYEVTAGSKQTYAVRVKTDGDDGWLEIYDENGEFLAAGRTYIELVWWGPRDHIRSLIGKDMPAEYDTKTTKWGTPLPW